jgi:hypothetical protein
MNTLLGILVSGVVLAQAAPEPEAVGSRKAHFLPLVQVSGTTAPSGELKVSPTFLIGLHSRLDLQISPVVKATTKEGSTVLNLAQPADGSAWSAGGGVVLHVLHRNTGNSGECTSRPTAAHCVALRQAIDACDRHLRVDEKFVCGQPTAADKDYCALRPGLANSANLDPEQLCPYGKQLYALRPPPGAFARRYPLAQIYAGGLAGTRKYEFLDTSDDGQARLSEPRMNTSVAAGAVIVSNAGLSRLPLTFELSFLHRARSTASQVPARWCVDKGMLAAVGAPVQSCMDGVLGGPTRSRSLAASALLGGIDVVDERWRFAAGIEFTYNQDTRIRGLAFKIPVHIRLTPGTGGSGYLGDYKGVLRLTPTVGSEWDAQGKVVGAKVLLVLDLIGQQDLFGSLLAGL